MAKPFLKWAGGKGALLPELLPLFPKKMRRYHEPFFGAGAVYFALEERGLLGELGAYINDICRPLMSCYSYLRASPESIIANLREHAEAHSSEYYYSVRKRFNEAEHHDPADFIYLNRTCYNGLYRVNRKGKFNTPVGRYVNPRICDPGVLRKAHLALQWTGGKLTAEDFEHAFARAEEGDVVYLDPPYVKLTPGSFVSYSNSGFTMADQERLAKGVEDLVNRGVFVLLSNSDTPWVQERYAKFEHHLVKSPRRIAARVKDRTPVQERIIVCRP